MRVKSVSIRDLSDQQLDQWRDWASPNGQLISPYLLPEFAQIVDQVRSDVRIAILSRENETIGYFAYHEQRYFGIRPVASPMSDYQGVVVRPNTKICPRDFLGQLGGGYVAFENWLANPACQIGKVHERDGSVVVDLSDGPDAYFASRRSFHKSHFKKLDRRLRNAQQEFGPARLVVGDAAGEAFQTLLSWKSSQYKKTGKLNLFDIDWARDLLERLHQRESQFFGGQTFALYFGDNLAAVEFGLKAGGVYHSWFPAYDERFAKVSPGLLLMHEIFKASPELGLTRIDLGKGGAQYKTYYASYEVPLHAGRILNPGLAALGIKSWDFAEQAAQILPGKLAELPVRARRRWAQVSAFEPELGPRVKSYIKGMGAQLNAA